MNRKTKTTGKAASKTTAGRTPTGTMHYQIGDVSIFIRLFDAGIFADMSYEGKTIPMLLTKTKDKIACSVTKKGAEHLCAKHVTAAVKQTIKIMRKQKNADAEYIAMSADAVLTAVKQALIHGTNMATLSVGGKKLFFTVKIHD